MLLLGANAQGKSNLLEAVYYPVLFRSFRGASDLEVGAFGGPGFRVEAEFESRGETHAVRVTHTAQPRRKRIEIDGAEVPRLADAVGAWVAVAFIPSDVSLAAGGAGERRRYLDRLLSLAERPYLTSLSRYRAALAQRNAALRQGRPDLTGAFDRHLAAAGACVVAARLRWVAWAQERFADEFAGLGEPAPVALEYRGDPTLADAAAWPEVLAGARERDQARGMTTRGPHRDDLTLRIGGRLLRAFGSTGQQRSAAVALKLLELATLREAHGTEPALLLDDVFAELDGDRQDRLARRLETDGRRQVFVSAPRRDELPRGLDLPVWTVVEGRVREAA